MDVNDVKERLRALAPDEKLRVQSLVEHKIDRFADVFAALGNGVLSRQEATLLRTYLTAEAIGLLP